MRLIPLRNRHGEVVASAKVDDCDYPWLSQWRWHLTAGGYAVRDEPMVNRKKGSTRYMHREIMGQPQSRVDHANGDTLDNQRHNLRLCTASQNSGNSRQRTGTVSRYKGVGWSKQKQKWRAYIGAEPRHLGFFETEEDAAHAYDRAAVHYFGEFAKTNFPS